MATDTIDTMFDDRTFRDTLGRFATGVAIVAAEVEGTLVGTTVSSFNSVSLSPPLVLFSLGVGTWSFRLWQKARGFGVTLLGDGQSDLSTRFARAGAEKWRPLAPERGPRGQPLIPGGLAHFECDVHARYEGGDHEIVVGRVVSIRTGSGEPLLFYRGRYRRIQPDQPISTPDDADVWLHGW